MFEKYFQFPERCAKCDEPEPEDEWQISRELPHHTLSREHTFKVAVPVCHRCKTTLSRARVVGILLGVALGLTAAFISWNKLISQWSGCFSIAVVTIIALGCGGVTFWVIQIVSGAYFAKFGDDSDILIFNNSVYQKEFDELNAINHNDLDA